MILFEKQEQRDREQMNGGGKGGQWDVLGDWDCHVYTINTMCKIDK